LARKVARQEGVAPELLLAVIFHESRFWPCAVSASGAEGLMQVKPATGLDVGVGNLQDPAQNIRAGARFLKRLLTRFDGNLERALRAYKDGPSTVEGRLGEMAAPEDTRRYVSNILELSGLLRAE
jgi:soluble lytic murein transglycosylase-like protein